MRIAESPVADTPPVWIKFLISAHGSPNFCRFALGGMFGKRKLGNLEHKHCRHELEFANMFWGGVGHLRAMARMFREKAVVHLTSFWSELACSLHTYGKE